MTENKQSKNSKQIAIASVFLVVIFYCAIYIVSKILSKEIVISIFFIAPFLFAIAKKHILLRFKFIEQGSYVELVIDTIWGSSIFSYIIFYLSGLMR